MDVYDMSSSNNAQHEAQSNNEHVKKYNLLQFHTIGNIHENIDGSRFSDPLAHSTDGDIINTTMVIYNSWISHKIDNYNSSMYYENPAYLFESYKAGTVLA